MADQRITQLNQLNEADVAATDVLPIVDISATETKKVTAKDLFEAGATLADNSSIDLAKLNQSSATKLGTTAIADDAVTYAKLQNVSATDRLLGRSSAGAGNVEEITLTAAGRALIDDADAAAQRTTLGLGTLSTQNASTVAITGGTITNTTLSGITDLAIADGGTGASTAAGARTNLGIVIGTDVQAYDPALASIAGLTTSANQVIYTTGADTYATTSLTAFGRSLIDDADAATARTTLGLGSISTQAANSVAITGGTADLTSATIGSVTITGGTISGITDLAIADGGTGASTAAGARTNLGIDIGTNVQAYSPALQSVANLTTSANQIIYTTAADTYAVASITSFGRSLIDDADASTARTTLGLGSLATQSGTFSGTHSGTTSGTNTGDQTITLTGDVTGSGTGSFAATIASDAVTTGKIINSAVTTAKINDAAVTGAKLAANSATVISGNAPAGNGAFQGQQWLNTNTGLTYVWTGSAWQQVAALQSVQFTDSTPLSFAVTKPDNFSTTITTTLDNQSAATVFAGPTSGAAAAPTFRALASTDLPVATASANGVMQPGTGLSVTGGGVLNHTNTVASGTYTKVTVDGQGHVSTGTTLSAGDIPSLDTSKITTGTFGTSLLANDSVTGAKLADSSTVQFGGAGSTAGVVTFPTAEFKGQYFFDELNGDLYIWTGSAWLPVTITSGELVYGGTYDASINRVGSVTSAGTAVGLTAGAILPAASATNNRYYLVVSDSGNGSGNAPNEPLAPPDMILSNGATWDLIDVSNAIAGQTATNISFTPYGAIIATNVQTALQELDDEKLAKAGGTVTGALEIGTTGSLVFEGSTADAYETTLGVVDPTADRSILLPNSSGTLITTGDTGVITSTMIADGTIVNGDINASAGIAYSKLAALSAGRLIVGNASNVPTAVDITGDVTINSSGVTAIGSGVIVNADINASAAIDDTKLAAISTSNKVNLSAIDIDGGTDIGTALADADLIIVDDGGGGTNRKAAVTRISDYTFGKVTGDISIASNGTASIGSGVIVDADINANAEIAVSKLADGAARQLLQTDAAGTGVEWTSNVDVPGTLDVTGVATFDSDVTCAGTGALAVPDGTTAQRPGAPLTGMLRFNTTTGGFEGYGASAWTSLGSSGVPADLQEFTSSGTYTKPSGTSFVLVEVWGAGGGGGSGRRGAASTHRSGGGGGGGGAYNYKVFKASEVGSTVTVTIGAGGTGGAAVTTNDTDGNAGADGGNTTFGSLLTGYGGNGGNAGSSGTGLGGGGGGTISRGTTTSGGAPALTGSSGVTGNAFGGGSAATGSGVGGASGFGGGGGGGAPSNAVTINAGGSSAYGGGGGGNGGSIVSTNGGIGVTATAATGVYGNAGTGGIAGSTAVAAVRAVAFGNSLFVASLSNGFITSSSDGTTWTAATSNAQTANNLGFAGLLYDGTRWVAWDFGNNTIWSSTDRSSWTVDATITGAFTWVVYNAGTYVAVGTGGSIRTSTDRVTWTSRTSGTTQNLIHIIYDGSRYIAVGQAGVSLTSTNSTSWTLVATGSAGDWRRVASNGSSTFVATSTATPYAWRSTDTGATWSAVATTLTPNGDIIYAGSQFVIATSSSAVYTSAAGSTWTTETDGTTDSYAGIAYSGSLYFIGSTTSNANVGIRSTAGTTWNTSTLTALEAAGSAGGSPSAVACAGGGGGASLNGYSSGAGGSGGAGLCRVYSW